MAMKGSGQPYRVATSLCVLPTDRNHAKFEIFFNTTLFLLSLFNIRNTIFLTLWRQFWKGIHAFTNSYSKNNFSLVFLDKVHLDEIGHLQLPAGKNLFSTHFLLFQFSEWFTLCCEVNKKVWLQKNNKCQFITTIPFSKRMHT